MIDGYFGCDVIGTGKLEGSLSSFMIIETFYSLMAYTI